MESNMINFIMCLLVNSFIVDLSFHSVKPYIGFINHLPVHKSAVKKIL